MAIINGYKLGFNCPHCNQAGTIFIDVTGAQYHAKPSPKSKPQGPSATPESPKPGVSDVVEDWLNSRIELTYNAEDFISSADLFKRFSSNCRASMLPDEFMISGRKFLNDVGRYFKQRKILKTRQRKLGKKLYGYTGIKFKK